MIVGSQFPIVESIAADATLSAEDLCNWHYVNCTAASAMTFPTAFEGARIGVFNYGAQSLTLKNAGGTAIGTLNQYQGAFFYVLPGSGAAPSWATAQWPVIGASGIIYLGNDVWWRSSGIGPVLRDSNSHFWRTTVAITGALTTTDLGASELGEAAP